METTQKDGLAIAKRVSDKKYNFLDANRNYLFDEWFDFVGDFSDGLARIKRSDKKYNYIGEDGKILSDEWFSYVDYFDEYDLAKVKRSNGEWAKIDKQGKIVVVSE